MTRAYILRAASPRMRQAEARRNALADHIAGGGTFADFRRAHSLTERGVQLMWKRICSDLGAQAA